jgi:RND family efflux transporter MFP subunit
METFGGAMIEEAAPARRGRLLLILGGVVVLGVLVGLIGLLVSVLTGEPDPQLVSIASVTSERGVRELRVAGITRAIRSAEISSDSAGRLVRCAVNPGARVNEGALLVELQPTATSEPQGSRRRSRSRSRSREEAPPAEPVSIRAPFSGIVSDVLVETGATVNAGQPVLVLYGTEGVELEVRVPVTEILGAARGSNLPRGNIARGLEVRVDVPNANLFGVRGTVENVGEAAAPATDVPVLVRLDSQLLVMPGLDAEVVFRSEPQRHLRVPAEAVVAAADGTSSVFVVRDNTAVQLPIEAGQLANGQMVVVGAIEAGDHVVVGGHEGLVSGTRVAAQGTGALATGEGGALAVRVASVDRATVRDEIALPGLIGPRDSYLLGFPQGGVISEVLIEVGDEVQRDQPIVQLDATTARAQASQAQEGLSRARRDLERSRTLAAGGSLPTAVMQDAETGAGVARANVAAANFALRYSTLRSPADGWIDAVLADRGEVVGPGQPIVRIASRERGWILRIAVPDREVAMLTVDSSATVSLDAVPGTRIGARVVEIARTPTPGLGTFDVDLELGVIPHAITLRTGLVGRATIPYGPAYQTSVPVSALVDGRERDAAVFTVENGIAHRVPVRIAFLKNDIAVIASGLDGIEQVVTAGSDRLIEGMPVAATAE